MDSTIDNADVNRNQTFFFNLGAWPRSYNNPLEEAKKHLLKCKWKLIEDRNSSCCFEKQSTHLYVHFLGFAVATGPDVSTDEVIANCGTKWLGNTSLPGREVKKQKIDGNNWEEEVAQAAAVLALEQLKDWATAPSFEGQVNSADRLFLQLQRIHELFPPNDKKVEETYKNELDEAVELMERIRRNASVEYHSSRFILALKVIEPAAIPAGTFFTGLGANDGPLWAWACAGMAFGAKLMMHLVLKMSHVDETPILQLPRRTVESDN
ncbi:hypothetical protein B0487_1156 [Bifidobacterium adolescentis]|uniref:Uncharacterized protein n=1 Tax=Bifidobacterium adolescentis TaxID=1680 RepID=A0A1X2Z1H1_BIFAD|nr:MULTISPECIES: hypothetical protein [Bifidobacterium]OSG88236.1 hypothetical protein B0487_1156 [Bifidobacterium adolescentis]RHJ04053.1 hypothetical protein DW144_09040 [Bifidobacterium adolescentis]RHJ18835.1 hypothetical protein DW139_04505 [Bifidobacterium adolescentis]